MKQSIVTQVQLMGARSVLNETVNFDKPYYEMMRQRLEDLTPQRAGELLALRQDWLSKARIFDAEARTYVVSKLTVTQYLQVEVDPLGIEKYADLAVESVLGVDTRGVPKGTSEPSLKDRVLDLRSDPIASQIIVVGMVSKSREILSRASNSLRFNADNLISPAYSMEKNSFSIGNATSFEDMKREAEKHFAEAVTYEEKQDLTTVDFNIFHHFLWEIFQARYRKFNESESTKYDPSSPRFYVIVKNDPKLWQELKEGKN